MVCVALARARSGCESGGERGSGKDGTRSGERRWVRGVGDVQSVLWKRAREEDRPGAAMEALHARGFG